MEYIVEYYTTKDAELNNSKSQFEFCNAEEIKKLEGNFSVYRKISMEELENLTKENLDLKKEEKND